MRARIVFCAATLGLSALTVAFFATSMAHADAEAGPPQKLRGAGLTPENRPTHITVPAEDAERLTEEAARSSRLPVLPARPRRPAPAQGTTRTLELDAPALENASDQFQFRDITERDPALDRSAEQRRLAVEAFRQSLRKKSR